MAMTNKFNGICNFPACRRAVPAGAGVVRKESAGWRTYCLEHSPEQLTPAVPAAPVKRELTVDGRVITPYEPANLPLLRSFPGARWNGDKKCWDVSLAEGDRARVLELANKLGLEVAPELRNIKQSEQALAAAGTGLYPFQVVGVDFLAKKSRALLGDEMGCGKSPTTLMALPAEARAIVICPACLKYNWRDEAARWRPDLKVTVLAGRGSFRAPSAGEVVVINYDILPDLTGAVDDATRSALSNTILVADECHAVKNYRAARSKKVKALAALCGKTWGLTGTPLLTRPPDLYGVLESLGLAGEVFGGFGRFMRLFGAQKGKWGGLVWGAPAPEVPELLRRAMLRRTRAEVLPELPRKTYTTLVINGLSASLRAKMDRLAEEWDDALELAEELPPFEAFSAVRAELAASRVDAVLEYVEDAEEQGVPLVVASAHRVPIDALAGRAGWGVITGDTSPAARQDVVRRFQAGELVGVGLTVQAGGVGITLTRAWKMLFVDLDWTPALNAQAEDRICRIGQTSDKVEIVRMVSDHILDQHVLSLIAKKIALIEGAVERSVAAKVPAAQPAAATPGRPGETEEEFAARQAKMKEEWDAAVKAAGDAEEAAKKARAAGKVKQIAERGLSKVGTFLAEPMTPEREAQIRGAFAVMCDNDPDMATERNGVGFSKADTFTARWLGYNLGSDEELRAMWSILFKYKQQLGDRFPLLYIAK